MDAPSLTFTVIPVSKFINGLAEVVRILSLDWKLFEINGAENDGSITLSFFFSQEEMDIAATVARIATKQDLILLKLKMAL